LQPGSGAELTYTRAEAARILLAGARRQGITPDDRTYLVRLVAGKTGAADPIQLIGPASLVGNSRETFHKSGTDGSNPVPSSRESCKLLVTRAPRRAKTQNLACTFSPSLPSLGIPIELSSGGPRSRRSPLRIRRRHTLAVLSAVRAHRGTDGSNPLSSSGESDQLRSLRSSHHFAEHSSQNPRRPIGIRHWDELNVLVLSVRDYPNNPVDATA